MWNCKVECKVLFNHALSEYIHADLLGRAFLLSSLMGSDVADISIKFYSIIIVTLAGSGIGTV